MIYPGASIDPRPTAVVDRGDRRWTFHQVVGPARDAIPTYRVEVRK